VRNLCVGLLCSAVSSVSLAQAPATTASAGGADVEARLFGARDNVTAMSLAPGGKMVAFIAPQPGGAGTLAYTADLTTGALKAFLRGGRTGETLRWCRFVTDSRLVCNYRTTLRLEGRLTPFSRLIAVNADGTGITQLGQSASDFDAGLRQFDGAVIDWLPDRAARC